MSKNVLIVAATASMIKQFNMRNIDILKGLGFQVWVAANFTDPGTITKDMSQNLREDLSNDQVKVIDIPFGRGVGDTRSNVRVMHLLNELIKKETFEFVHVHSALASVLVRLVCGVRRVPVLYTVHGFQFMKGGDKLRWLSFFPIEFLLSFLTKEMVTINQHDFDLATKYFPCTVKRINGVGIDYDRFKQADIYNANNDKKIFITVGELSDRKNQEMIIKSFSLAKRNNWEYWLIGIGPKLNELKNLVEDLGLEDKVKFLGYSKDVREHYRKANVAIFASKMEGLLTAGMEAMATGVPIIYSDVRGIKDYLVDNVTGFKIEKLDVKSIARRINDVLETETEDLEKIGEVAQLSAAQFDKSVIDADMRNVYLKWVRE